MLLALIIGTIVLIELIVKTLVHAYQYSRLLEHYSEDEIEELIRLRKKKP